MFTGIVTALCKVIDIKLEKKDYYIFSIAINKSYMFKWSRNESYLISGVCLSLIQYDNKIATFGVTSFTYNSTALSIVKANDYVNVERSLMGKSRISGSIIYGHVDTIATLAMKAESDYKSWYRYTFCMEEEHMIYAIKKGCISVNGVNLTVAMKGNNTFTVNVIPLTYNLTNFQYLDVGDKVSIEFDTFVKYTVSILSSDYLKKFTIND